MSLGLRLILYWKPAVGGDTPSNLLVSGSRQVLGFTFDLSLHVYMPTKEAKAVAWEDETSLPTSGTERRPSAL